MNYLYNAMCSNGEKIWCIDAKGALYEIDRCNNKIELVHRIEELDDERRQKFQVMCYSNGNLIIAPYRGQSFWLYNIQTKHAECLTDPESKTYGNFYDYKDKIFFIDATVSTMAIYDKNNCSIQKENINNKSIKEVDQRITRGGCVLEKGENTVYQSIFGTNRIYQICLDDLRVIEKKTPLDIPLALSHKMNDLSLYVATNGEIWQEKDEEIIQLEMPKGAKKCVDSYAPYHYWTRAGGGLVLLPCGMNMVLHCKAAKIRNVYTSSNETNVWGQIGVYPCCSIESNTFAGFPRYEDALYEFDLTKHEVQKRILKVDASNGEMGKCIALKTQKSQEIYEGDFDITLREWLNIVQSVKE